MKRFLLAFALVFCATTVYGQDEKVAVHIWSRLGVKREATIVKLQAEQNWIAPTLLEGVYLDKGHGLVMVTPLRHVSHVANETKGVTASVLTLNDGSKHHGTLHTWATIDSGNGESPHDLAEFMAISVTSPIKFKANATDHRHQFILKIGGKPGHTFRVHSPIMDRMDGSRKLPVSIAVGVGELADPADFERITVSEYRQIDGVRTRLVAFKAAGSPERKAAWANVGQLIFPTTDGYHLVLRTAVEELPEFSIERAKVATPKPIEKKLPSK